MEIREVLRETYAASDRMNQLLLEHIHQRACRALPPGLKGHDGRTIAAIFAHVHNNRLVWLNRSAPHLRRPSPLDPIRCTMRQAATAHPSSAARCLQMLKEAVWKSRTTRDDLFTRQLGAFMAGGSDYVRLYVRA